ncbi:MAG TPA: ammonium transporter [Mycobacteriales bacterium]|nr:ammonium transporter [Mycobacteriales bacterium]
MLDSGHTAWLLTASALVLLMTPGLAFFYGGLTRAKSTLNMMLMSFASIGVVSLLWVLVGFSISFGPTVHGLFGNLHFFGLNALGGDKIGNYASGVPDLVFVAFQLMFAIITVALISGAIADRTRFGAWIVFSTIWAIIVYFPVAHWVFYAGTAAPVDKAGKILPGVHLGNGAASSAIAGSGGWIINRLGALDFAGGTAVHINAGAAALALCLVLGRRKGWPGTAMKPHNVPFVLLGSGLLWFGWFGFNAGSALQANGLAAQAFVNTQLATAIGGLAWMATERLRDGHATNVGFASGAVAGLVAITPACGSVNSLGSVAVGAIAGVLCALAVGMKYRLGFDDSLDVVGVHLVGGLAGTLLVGLLATHHVDGVGVDGLLFGGGFKQLGIQAIAAISVGVYSFVVAFILGKLIDRFMGFRISEEDELTGIDLAVHAETAYELTGGFGSSLAAAGHGQQGHTSAVPAASLGTTTGAGV